DLIGDEDRAHSISDQDIRFRQRSASDSHGPCGELTLGELRALVILVMRAKPRRSLFEVTRHAREIALHRGQVDQKSGCLDGQAHSRNSKSGRLGDSRTIAARVRASVVHFGSRVMHDHLARTEEGRIGRANIQFVTSGDKLLLHSGRNAVLDADLATSGRLDRETRRIDRSLNVHLEIDEVGDELGLRLRLVHSTDNAEADMQIALFEEGRHQRMKRPGSGPQRVWLRGSEKKSTAAIVKMKTAPFDCYAVSKGITQTLDNGGYVAVPVGNSQVHGVAQFRLSWFRRTIRFARIDAGAPPSRI